jgi:hypothetical protein
VQARVAQDLGVVPCCCPTTTLGGRIAAATTGYTTTAASPSSRTTTLRLGLDCQDELQRNDLRADARGRDHLSDPHGPLCAVVAGICAVPSAASAATCADYPNQAAAQRAHDTVDGDGDGVYREALPCPCLKPGQPGSGGSTGGTPGGPERKRTHTYLGRISRVVDGDTVTSGSRARRPVMCGCA